MLSNPYKEAKVPRGLAGWLLLVSAGGLDKPALPRPMLRFLPCGRGGLFRRAIELFAGAGDLCLVADRPIAKRRDRRQQVAPERREFIIDPRRNRREHRAGDEAIAFEPAQGQGQHALRNAADRAAQLIET